MRTRELIVLCAAAVLASASCSPRAPAAPPTRSTTAQPKPLCETADAASPPEAEPDQVTHEVVLAWRKYLSGAPDGLAAMRSALELARSFWYEPGPRRPKGKDSSAQAPGDDGYCRPRSGVRPVKNGVPKDASIVPSPSGDYATVEFGNLVVLTHNDLPTRLWEGTSPNWITGDLLSLDRYPLHTVADVSDQEPMSELACKALAADDKTIYCAKEGTAPEQSQILRLDRKTRRLLAPLRPEAIKPTGAARSVSSASGTDCLGRLSWGLGMTVTSGLLVHDGCIWNLETGRLAFAFRRLPTTHGAAVSPDGRWLAVPAVRPSRDEEFGFEALVVLIDLRTRAISALMHCNIGSNVAFSHNGQLLAVGELCRAGIYSMKSRSLVRRTGWACDPESSATEVADMTFFANDSGLFVIAPYDSAAFRVSDGKPIWNGGGPPDWTAEQDGKLWLWRQSDNFTTIIDHDTATQGEPVSGIDHFGSNWRGGPLPLPDLDKLKRIEAQFCFVQGDGYRADWPFPRAICDAAKKVSAGVSGDLPHAVERDAGTQNR